MDSVLLCSLHSFLFCFALLSICFSISVKKVYTPRSVLPELFDVHWFSRGRVITFFRGHCFLFLLHGFCFMGQSEDDGSSSGVI